MKKMERMRKFVVLNMVAVSLIMVCQTPILAYLNLTKNQVSYAAEDDGEELYVDPGPSLKEPIPLINTLSDITILDNQDIGLVINPTDRKLIEENKVDVRVADYLEKLITPVEQGGYGFKRINVKRINRNYISPSAQLDKESLAAVEEDPGIVSAHHRGQAADISEIDSIVCKLTTATTTTETQTTQNSDGTSTTTTSSTTTTKEDVLPPTPIKVAWQSRLGMKLNPTPNGVSMAEAAGLLSTQEIKTVVNNTENTDETVDYMKGLDLSTIIAYVGANSVTKKSGIENISGDPLAGNWVTTIGLSNFQKELPNLGESLMAQDENEDIRIAVAKSTIEQSLKLPPGSLRGYGWEALLTSMGKRAVEASANLPSLYFEKHTINEANTLPFFQAVFENWSRQDGALNIPQEGINKLKNNDESGFRLAGAKIFTQTFKLSPQKETVFINAVKSGDMTPIDSNFYLTLTTGGQLTAPDLQNMMSTDAQLNQKARDSLKEFGLGIIKTKVDSSGGRLKGFTVNEVKDLLNISLDLPLYKVAALSASSSIAENTELDLTKVKKSLVKKDYAEISRAMADKINTEDMADSPIKVTSEDVDAAMKGDNRELYNKVGGTEMDKAFGWDNGTGYKVATNQTNYKDAFTEMFSNGISIVIDANIKGVPLAGPIFNKFGAGVMASNLGLDYDSIISAGDAKASEYANQIGVSKFNDGFGTDEDSWLRTDAYLAIPSGSTKNLVKANSKISDFAKMVGKTNISYLTIEKLYDYFEITKDEYKLTDDESTKLIDSLKSWDTLSSGNRSSAIDLGLKLVARSKEILASVKKDTFYNYVTAGSDKERGKILLNHGVDTFANNIANNGENPSQEESDRVSGLINRSFNSRDYRSSSGELNTTMAKSFNVPEDNKGDFQTFGDGNMKTTLSTMSYKSFDEGLNPSLPDDHKLTYEKYRNNNIVDNNQAEQRGFELMKKATGITSYSEYTSSPQHDYYYNLGRKSLFDQTRQETSWTMSTAFIRKTDKTIPGDFVKVAMNGSKQELAQNVQEWLLNSIDADISGSLPGSWVAGTLTELYNHTGGSASSSINQINSNSVTDDPLTTDDLVRFVRFAAASSSERLNMSKDASYQNMWNNLDQYGRNRSGLGNIQNGTTQAIAETNSTGNADKLEHTNPDFNTNFDGWVDNKLAIPNGSTYMLAKSYKNIQDSQDKLDAATTNEQRIEAQKNLAIAEKQYQLTGIVILLTSCKACNSTFSSIDRALGLKSGTALTIAAIAILSWLGWDTTTAEGADPNKAPDTQTSSSSTTVVEYKCPIPIREDYIYSIPTYDLPGDELVFKWQEQLDKQAALQKAIDDKDYTKMKSMTPTVEDGDDNDKIMEKAKKYVIELGYADGNDPDLWMAWSRHYVGKVLSSTMEYGKSRDLGLKPKQVITFRRANVEFFTPQAGSAFGKFEASNPYIGIGYSQDSTKTTDWIHVAFGGTL